MCIDLVGGVRSCLGSHICIAVLYWQEFGWLLAFRFFIGRLSAVISAPFGNI